MAEGKKWDKKQFFIGLAMLIIAIIGLVFVYSGNANKPISDKIKIGVIVPLSGEGYGANIKEGIRLAGDDIENDIEIMYEEAKCDEGDLNVINGLISVDKVQALIIDFCGNVTQDIIDIASEDNVVVMSLSPIKISSDYVYKIIPKQASKARFDTELMFYKYNAKELGIIYSEDEYGNSFKDSLKDNFEKLGGRVVVSEGAEKNAIDLKAQINKIKNAKPDAIYIATDSKSSATASIKQIRESNLSAFIFSNEHLLNQDTLSLGNISEGVVITSLTLGVAGFIEKYKSEYNEEPGKLTAQGYDAFNAIALAVNSGAKTGTEIKDALKSISFEGASGKIGFDDDNAVIGDYEVFAVKSGKFVRA